MDSLPGFSHLMVWNEPNTRDEYFGDPDIEPRGYGTDTDPVDTPRERCSLYVQMCWLAKQAAESSGHGQKVVAGGVSMVRRENADIGKSPGVEWMSIDCLTGEPVGLR